jgi:hypothetical protein
MPSGSSCEKVVDSLEKVSSLFILELVEPFLGQTIGDSAFLTYRALPLSITVKIDFDYH